jgi:hypothetical protein
MQYRVDKLMNHAWDSTGRLIFRAKYEGFKKPEWQLEACFPSKLIDSYKKEARWLKQPTNPNLDKGKQPVQTTKKKQPAKQRSGQEKPETILSTPKRKKPANKKARKPAKKRVSKSASSQSLELLTFPKKMTPIPAGAMFNSHFGGTTGQAKLITLVKLAADTASHSTATTRFATSEILTVTHRHFWPHAPIFSS